MTTTVGLMRATRLLLSAALVVAAGMFGFLAAVNGRFVDLALLMLVGGLALAAVRADLGARSTSIAGDPDPFARDARGQGMIDVSNVRVAGLGGAGLVVIAAAIATQFRIIGFAVLISVVGGALLGALMIVRHRIGSRPS
jgi:hypothetical protein